MLNRNNMIEVQEYHAITLNIEDNDIGTFLSIMKKLLVSCQQAGFKKVFNVAERELIERIGDNLNVEKPQECSINVSETNKVY